MRTYPTRLSSAYLRPGAAIHTREQRICTLAVSGQLWEANQLRSKRFASKTERHFSTPSEGLVRRGMHSFMAFLGLM